MKKFLLLFSLLIFTAGCENTSEPAKENRMYFKAKVDGEYIVTDRIPDNNNFYICIDLKEELLNDTLRISFNGYFERKRIYSFSVKNISGNYFEIPYFPYSRLFYLIKRVTVDASVKNKPETAIPSGTFILYDRY